MKKTFFAPVFLSLVLFYGCSIEPEKTDTTNSSELIKLQEIAKTNGFILTKSIDNEKVYKVSSIKELKEKIKAFKDDLNQTKIKTIGDTSKIDFKAADNLLKQLLNEPKIKRVFSTSSTEGAIDPPYKHTTTVYIDNTFPWANVYVTINYNIDSTGRLTSAEVKTGTWGTFIGGFEQTNVVGSVQNGIFVFQVSGQYSASVGFGNFTLDRNTGVNIFGYIQRGNGGGSSGFVKQQPNDQKEEANF